MESKIKLGAETEWTPKLMRFKIPEWAPRLAPSCKSKVDDIVIVFFYREWEGVVVFSTTPELKVGHLFLRPNLDDFIDTDLVVELKNS